MRSVRERLKAEGAITIKQAIGLDIYVSPVTDRQLRRWMDSGIRGVRLDRFWNGGQCYTSKAAIERFLDAINGGEDA
jgi:hypothetical protein